MSQTSRLGCNPFTAAVALFDPVFGFGIPPSRLARGRGLSLYAFDQDRHRSVARPSPSSRSSRPVSSESVPIVAIASPMSLAELTFLRCHTRLSTGTWLARRFLPQVQAIVGDDLRFVFDTYTFGDPSLARSIFDRLGGLHPVHGLTRGSA